MEKRATDLYNENHFLDFNEVIGDEFLDPGRAQTIQDAETNFRVGAREVIEIKPSTKLSMLVVLAKTVASGKSPEGAAVAVAQLVAARMGGDDDNIAERSDECIRDLSERNNTAASAD